MLSKKELTFVTELDKSAKVVVYAKLSRVFLFLLRSATIIRIGPSLSRKDR